jgi:hypothetical protein
MKKNSEPKPQIVVRDTGKKSSIRTRTRIKAGLKYGGV